MRFLRTGRRGRWGLSARRALRRWWWVVVLCFLVAEALGVVAGLRATYSATSYVQSYVAANDALSQEAAGKNALFLVNSTQVYERAAKSLSIDSEDLQRRTRVVAQPGTNVVSIAVSSRDPQRALDEANGLALAGVAEDAARRERDLQDIRERITQLLVDGTLEAPEAERARRVALGQALGVAVTDRVTSQGRLSVVQAAVRDRVAKTSSRLIAVMGAIGGILVGLGIVVLLGGRTGRVSSLKELQELYPDTTVIEFDDIPDVAAVEGAERSSLVITAADGETEEWLAVVRSAMAEAQTGLQAVGVRPRSRLVRQGRVPEDALMMVGVVLGTTRVRDLDDLLANAPEGTYLLAGS